MILTIFFTCEICGLLNGERPRSQLTAVAGLTRVGYRQAHLQGYSVVVKRTTTDQGSETDIVLTDRDLLVRITEIHPYAKMLLEAPAAIVVCGNMNQKHKDFWIQDCSAAVQNMLLEATHQGLGSVWLGVYPRQDRIDGLTKMFNLPESVIPFAVVALGYAKEPLSPVDRFNPAYIHRNEW